jgi:hypothetical protein
MQKVQFLTPENVKKCFQIQSNVQATILINIASELCMLSGSVYQSLPLLANAFSVSTNRLLDQARALECPEFDLVISGQTELAKSIQRYIHQCEFLNCSDELTTHAMAQEFIQYYPGVDKDTDVNYIQNNGKYIKYVLGNVPSIHAPALSDFDYSIEINNGVTKYHHPLEGICFANTYLSKKDNQRLMDALNLKVIETGIVPANQETLEDVAHDIIHLLKSIDFERVEYKKFKNVRIDQSLQGHNEKIEVNNNYQNNQVFNGERLVFSITFSKENPEFNIYVDNILNSWDVHGQHTVKVNCSIVDNVVITKVDSKGWVQYSQLLIEEVKRIIEELAQEVRN